MATRAKILRQTKRVSRLEKQQRNKEKIEYYTQGTGLFVYRNKSRVGELRLQMESADGQKVIPPLGEFTGNSYFHHLIKTHEVTLVRCIEPETPYVAPTESTETETEVVTQEPEETTKEQVMTENTQNQDEKLILDQPDTVTTEGTVEHVVADPEAQTLNEDENTENKDVLLNEDPLDGVDILSD